MQARLAVRIDADNPDHHLWNNHGTWWIHYTLELDAWRTQRVRRSLGTSDVSAARELRDELFARCCPAFEARADAGVERTAVAVHAQHRCEGSD